MGEHSRSSATGAGVEVALQRSLQLFLHGLWWGDQGRPPDLANDYRNTEKHMGKIIGAYQNLQSAQEAMSRLVETIGDATGLSIIGPDGAQFIEKTSLNKTWV